MESFYFESYAEWKEAITVRCRIRLTPEYAAERLCALRDEKDRTTREFIDKYGEAYHQQVIAWFELAESGKQ